MVLVNITDYTTTMVGDILIVAWYERRNKYVSELNMETMSWLSRLVNLLHTWNGIIVIFIMDVH